MKKDLVSKRFALSEAASRHISLPPRSGTARQRFLEKCDRGYYQFESCACVCGAHDDVIVAEVDKDGLPCQNVICRACGLIRINPRLTQDSYGRFYNDEYRDLYGDLALNEQRWEGLVRQGEEAFQFFAPHIGREKGTIFEVGCYMGAYLYPFYRRGWDAAGVDYGSAGIDFGRRISGITTLCHGGLEKLEALDRQADVMLCNHVVEHFADLKCQLARIRQLLKPDGLFVIGLPGLFWWPVYSYGGDCRPLFQTAHCWQFSLAGITEVLEEMGFERVYGDEIIRAVFRKKGEGGTAVTRDSRRAQKAIRFLKHLERWRHVYRLRAAVRSGLLRILTWLRLKPLMKTLLRVIRGQKA